MMRGQGHRARWFGVAGIALASVIIPAPRTAADDAVAGEAQDVAAVKAAFVYNFAKFTEWPGLASGVPLVVCIAGDNAMAAALAGTVRGQNIGGHTLDVTSPQDRDTWQGCQVLFAADSEVGRSGERLDALKTLPVLTVSDAKGFSEAGGIIELYLDDGRMRFAINVEAGSATSRWRASSPSRT